MTEGDLKLLEEQSRKTREGRKGFDSGFQWASEQATYEQLVFLPVGADLLLNHPEMLLPQSRGGAQGATYWTGIFSAHGFGGQLKNLDWLRGFSAGALAGRVQAMTRQREERARQVKEMPTRNLIEQILAQQRS